MATRNQKILTSKALVSETYDKFEAKLVTRFAWPETMNSLFFSNLETFIEVEKDVITDFEDDDEKEIGEDEVEQEIQATGFDLFLTLRHVKTPELDCIALDYTYQGADWGLLGKGKLIIRINDEFNIILEPIETDSDEGFANYNGVQEVGYYILSPEDLRSICDADFIEIKMKGGNFEFVLDETDVQEETGSIPLTDKFLFLCRGFYDGLYDDDAYLEFCAEVWNLSKR